MSKGSCACGGIRFEMEDVRSIKQKLTGAQTSIRTADELLEAMAGSVRGHLARIDELLAGAD